MANYVNAEQGKTCSTCHAPAVSVDLHGSEEAVYCAEHDPRNSIATDELRCFNAIPMPRLHLPNGNCWGTGTIQPGEPYRSVDLHRIGPSPFCMACVGTPSVMNPEGSV